MLKPLFSGIKLHYIPTWNKSISVTYLCNKNFNNLQCPWGPESIEMKQLCDIKFMRLDHFLIHLASSMRGVILSFSPTIINTVNIYQHINSKFSRI